jgi:hypothetical protein
MDYVVTNQLHAARESDCTSTGAAGDSPLAIKTLVSSSRALHTELHERFTREKP